ncbi:Ala-tRNA(Pro) deacylase [Bosea sp. OAE752]|jgi:Ala-tRNA(Pro) deacylase|uniref:Prolyl-tRNA synthetase associated domain-containing protein n=1 Tax=Bosea spartocytisi TaxID=2773451 RepID=A0A927EB75_9HYPH|nr:prolyl-tRNA synthetase associated domain-containing protein [Bosea spartocytisi]MBD3846151.1 prolyl-tRNA synthetase associated domain-containing protein [Bosea spartocytisi]MCT4473335.1 prolyl-tRNA synthetase associated domain-containing protein [Bosea spartocytisi]
MIPTSQIIPLTDAELCARLAASGIAFHRTDHPAVFTVAETAPHRDMMIGLQTKNLFLKDKKGRLFLVSAKSDARIDLKRLHETLGASGRLSFGSAELLLEKLGVTPGSVTAFAVVNDREGAVTMVLDANLTTGEEVNFHPLVNTATLRIGRDDLVAFLRETGHEPLIVDLPVPPDGQNG